MMSDEELIWQYLMNRFDNEFGVAALIGNLMAESSLNPQCVTGLNKTPYKTAADYIIASNNGEHDFVHDGVAFGLAQWCFSSRKQGLLDCARARHDSIGYIYLQLEYLYDELHKYKTVYDAIKSATDIRTVSDVIMLKYEKPANTSETMKKRRERYAQDIYDKYAEGHTPEPKPEPGKQFVVALADVNIRSGDSKDYPVVSKLKKDSMLEFVTESPDTGWYAVRADKRIGWVSCEFSTIVGKV